jgi:hypothetical protein
MRKFLLSIAFFAITSLTSASKAAQLPSIALFDSLSYSTQVTNWGLVTIFSGSMNVPNIGALSHTDAIPHDDGDVRIVDSGENNYIGIISLLTPGQINFWASAAPISNPFLNVPLDSTVAVKVQRKIGGVWTDVSAPANANFTLTAPNNPIVGGHINAALYAFTAGRASYYFLKNTADGQPNPRTQNGEPTFLAFFVTGASKAYTPFSLCNTTLKLNGVNANGQLLSDFVPSGFAGLEQINVLVPGSITNTTTIQFGTSLAWNWTCPGAATFGGVGTIDNWEL